MNPRAVSCRWSRLPRSPDCVCLRSLEFSSESHTRPSQEDFSLTIDARDSWTCGATRFGKKHSALLCCADYFCRRHRARFSVLEFALVNWAARQDLVAHSRARYRQSPLFFRNPDSRQENSHHFYAPIQQEVTLEDLPFSWWDKIWKIRYKERSRRIDLISRVMFPLCFIIFNIMYWWRYLIPYMAVQAQLE